MKFEDNSSHASLEEVTDHEPFEEDEEGTIDNGKLIIFHSGVTLFIDEYCKETRFLPLCNPIESRKVYELAGTTVI